jgi:DNA repair exonuclease SbcCD ATPase subunit
MNAAAALLEKASLATIAWDRHRSALQAAELEEIHARELTEHTPPAVALTPEQRAGLQVAADAWTQADALERALQARCGTVRLRIQRLRDRMTADQRRQAQLDAWLAKTALAAAVVARIDKRLGQEQVLRHRVGALEGQLIEARQSQAAKERAVAAAEAAAARFARRRELLQVLETARDTLHRDKLPRAVALDNLARVETRINEHGLPLFGRPFWVESQADLTFLVHKPGHPGAPQEQLSVGQKVILAVSFWSAVALLWSRKVGILALDEPTSNLDTDNRLYLGEAMARFASQVRGNRQVLVVTHDHNLRGCFDQVIDLSPEGGT